MLNRFSFLFLLLLLLIENGLAHAYKTIVVHKQSDNFDLKLRYPQSFKDNSINIAILNFINNTQIAEGNPDTQNQTGPGKNSLSIDYQLAFQTKKAISILFNISTYNRGAAHPNNTIKTFNFVNGQSVHLSDLFVNDRPYLGKISSFCQKNLLDKKVSDSDWVMKGTAARQENYKNWHFTKQGIAIIFDTYQVAAYVNGPQTVTVPLEVFKKSLRPEIEKEVWGKNDK